MKWIGFLCGITGGTALAAIGTLAEFLDLEVPLPQNIKWIIWITAAVLLIAGCLCRVCFFKKEEETTPRPANKSCSEASEDGTTLSNSFVCGHNTSNYLDTVKDRAWTNQVNIEDAKFSLILNDSGETSMSGEPLINQSVQWTLVGSNPEEKPLREYGLIVTLSVFTSWNTGAIKISAKAKVENGEFQEVQPRYEPVTGSEDMRCLMFSLPEDVIHAQQFVLEITMTWTRGCYFKDIERYFSDPRNYGNRLNSLVIEVHTDSGRLAERKFTLQRVNKQSREATPLNWDQTSRWKYRRTLHNPDMEALYQVEVKHA